MESIIRFSKTPGGFCVTAGKYGLAIVRFDDHITIMSLGRINVDWYPKNIILRIPIKLFSPKW